MAEHTPSSASSTIPYEKPAEANELDIDTDRKSSSSRSSISSSESDEEISRTEPIQGITRGNDGQGKLSRVASRLSTRTGKSLATVDTHMTTDPAYEIDFAEGTGENPVEWNMLKKGLVIASMSYSTLIIQMYSTSYSAGIPGMMKTFDIGSETLLVLGITTYLIGLAVGSLILAPLSEMYGRRPVYLVSILMFVILIIPCGLAKNLETILVVRFFGAIAGSAMICNAPGTVSDIASDEYRALAFSIWSIGPMNGPVVGPLVGGFVFEYLGWRWDQWVVMIGSAVSWGIIFLIPETYAPALLRRKAAKKREETGDSRFHSRYDDKQAFWPMLKVNLTRPLIMAVKEPICIFWNIYIAVVYGILYLCFVAYPIVFSNLRGWSPGLTGLSYVGLGIGGLITIACEPLLRRMINNHKPDPETGKPPPEAMISVVVIAAIAIPVGELIFAWTCTPNVHWIAPILASIPFGAGNCGVFIYASNYLVHSYGIYAASSLAGNAVLRSVLGGSLPLAGPAMYAKLGPHWSGSMLAILEFALVPIPVVFYKYGHRIRNKSALIRQMREDRARLEGRKAKAEERGARRREAEEGFKAPEEKERELFEV